MKLQKSGQFGDELLKIKAHKFTADGCKCNPGLGGISICWVHVFKDRRTCQRIFNIGH
jgi:hypothetical protein